MLLSVAFALLSALAPIASASANPNPSSNSELPKTLSNIPVKEDAKVIPAALDPKSTRVHPASRTDLCITVLGGEFALGAEIGIAYCFKPETDWATWQVWDLSLAQASSGGQIKITDPKAKAEFCLGIGADDQSGGRPRLEACTDPKDALGKGQCWGAKGTSIANHKSTCGADGASDCNQCLDIRGASAPFEGKNWASQRDIQTWTCAGKDETNPQQMWTPVDPNGSRSGSAPPPDTQRRSVWAREGRTA